MHTGRLASKGRESDSRRLRRSRSCCLLTTDRVQSSGQSLEIRDDTGFPLNLWIWQQAVQTLFPAHHRQVSGIGVESRQHDAGLAASSTTLKG